MSATLRGAPLTTLSPYSRSAGVDRRFWGSRSFVTCSKCGFTGHRAGVERDEYLASGTDAKRATTNAARRAHHWCYGITYACCVCHKWFTCLQSTVDWSKEFEDEDLDRLPVRRVRIPGARCGTATRAARSR